LPKVVTERTDQNALAQAMIGRMKTIAANEPVIFGNFESLDPHNLQYRFNNIIDDSHIPQIKTSLVREMMEFDLQSGRYDQMVRTLEAAKASELPLYEYREPFFENLFTSLLPTSPDMAYSVADGLCDLNESMFPTEINGQQNKESQEEALKNLKLIWDKKRTLGFEYYVGSLFNNPDTSVEELRYALEMSLIRESTRPSNNAVASALVEKLIEKDLQSESHKQLALNDARLAHMPEEFIANLERKLPPSPTNDPKDGDNPGGLYPNPITTAVE
jgi:hypothetical protein